MHFAYEFLLLAVKKHTEAAANTDAGGKSASLSWAIVIFFLALGMVLTLMPARRTYEFKRSTEE